MFMTVIKTTDSVAELVSVIDIVDCDIARWRSKDTGGSDGMYSYLFACSLFFHDFCTTLVSNALVPCQAWHFVRSDLEAQIMGTPRRIM